MAAFLHPNGHRRSPDAEDPMELAPALTRLADLPAGSEARVDELRLGRDAASLLCALGLRPSRHVRVSVNRGICIVQVGFTRIGFSREIGRGIVVTRKE